MPAHWGEYRGDAIASQPATRPTTRPAFMKFKPATQPAELAAWWKRFNDPVLDDLMQQAICGNLTLRQAQARVVEARAARQIVWAGLWPTVNADASYDHFHFSKNGFGASAVGTPGASGGTAGGGTTGGGTSGSATGGATGNSTTSGAVSSPKRDFNLYQLGLDASWELDVFGKVQREVEAADANTQASIEDRRDVLVMLLAEVAMNYIEMRGSQQQILIARENMKAQQETVNLTRLRFEGGIATELDLAQAQAQLANTQSTIPPLEASIRENIHLLGTLVGKDPMALSELLSTPAQIPPPPPEIPLGLPSGLLRQRADVRRAERNLASATALVGAAVANLFPSFSLTGNTGYQSLHAHNLFGANSFYWNAGPSMSWPIFDAGAIRAGIHLQSAVQEQFAAAYEDSVLTSLKEVEDALAAYGQEQLHLVYLSESVAANKRALDLANLQFEQGLSDFLNVLIAQRSLFLSEDALAQSTRTLSMDVVALYKALGGGWECADWEGNVATQPVKICD